MTKYNKKNELHEMTIFFIYKEFYHKNLVDKSKVEANIGAYHN